MVYIMNVEWYDDINGSTEEINGFVTGNSYNEVLTKVVNYYGEQELESVRLELFGPKDMLEFFEDKTGLFKKVKNAIAEDIIWQENDMQYQTFMVNTIYIYR